MFNLSNKVAIVTGAGRGIGQAIALGFAEANADVVVIARNAKEIGETKERIEALGRKSLAFQLDVTDDVGINEMVEQVYQEFGRIDILVNNAGINLRNQIFNMPKDDWDKIINTNLTSMFLLNKAVGKYMVEKRSGSVINISSVAGIVGMRTGVAYASSKAAIIQMTKTLALEWGKYNVRINAIAPWYFRTPLTENLLNNQDYLREVEGKTPLGRVGELKELVAPAIFLASDAASYITGHTLVVDGGMSINGF